MCSPADHALAAALAEEAGALLVALRASGGGDIRDRGDNESNVLLLERLAVERPADAVLSEESADDARRLGASRVWIVDPLDGTREFGEPGRTDWAVHVALAVDGKPRVGAVALPGLATVLSTAAPPRLPSAHGGPPRILVSRTRPPALADELAAALGGTLVPMGSAGAKAMAVVRGEADIYAHAGGQYEWDSAAPVAVAAAAGCHVSRLDGAPLAYNQANPWLPDLLICRPELASDVLAVTGR